MTKKINDPGVRPHRSGTGVVIQQSRRSQQLNGIAEDLASYLRNRKVALEENDPEYKQVHRLLRSIQQVGIIADELKAAGK